MILEDGTKCKFIDGKFFSTNLGFIFWKSYLEKVNLCINKKYFKVLYAGYASLITETSKNEHRFCYLLHFDDYEVQITMN